MWLEFIRGCFFSCVAGILIAACGCAGPGKTLEPPRAQLAGIRVNALRMFEATFQVEVRLFNVNDVPLEIKAVDCELEVNGKPFATGVSKNAVQIPAYGSDIVSVELYSSFVEVLKGAMDMGKEERLRYRLKGRVHLSGGFMVPPWIPFSAEGAWPPEGMKTP